MLKTNSVKYLLALTSASILGIVITFALVLFETIFIPQVAQAASEPSIVNANELPEALVSFKSPLTISDIVKLTSEKGLRIEMVEGEFTVGSTQLYDWYFVKPGMDAKAIEEDYKNARLGYLQDVVDGEEKLPAEQRKALSAQFNDMKGALQRKDTGAVVIKNVTVAGVESAIGSLSTNEKVDKVNKIKAKPDAGKVFTPPQQELQNKIERGTPRQDSKVQGTSAVNAAAVTQSLPSVPRYGRSDTKTSSLAGKRETLQYMYWENINFGENQTYEHEVFFDNFDGQTFLNSATTPPVGCFPVTDYVATSWPASARPYIDTRVNFQGQCVTNELEFTLGAFQANQLQANTWYQNYFRTTNGNASNDRFRVGAQVGHKNPVNCPAGQETWCSYGDSPELGDRRVDLLQAWNTEVPFVRDWAWNVRFCEHNRDAGYGRCLDLVPGTHDLTEYLFNDKLTTIRLPLGLKWNVMVYDNVNPSTNYCYGNSWKIIANGGRTDVNLYENNMNFNDKASCAVVELQ